MRGALQKLDGSSFDIAIIGAGINGAAYAHHLVAAGYHVLLVDKGDFAGGATSRSGRILHCGLRFMAPKRRVSEYFLDPGSLLTKLRVASEMAKNLGELYQTIPERLRPMKVALPIYRGAGYSGWHVDLGARFIGYINRNKSPILYNRTKGTTSLHPFIKLLRDKEDIRSVVSFVDQQFYWPERIALDAVFSAQELGAMVRNYTRVEQLTRSESKGWTLTLAEVRDGAATAKVTARLVFNLAGAWIDEVNGRIRTNSPASRKVRAMKGVHFLIKLPAEYRSYGIAGETRHGEHIFCLPWGDMHYIGPTETVYEGNLDEVVPDEGEIDFLLDEIQHLLPALTVKRDAIVLSWAGIRPITFNRDMPQGQRLPFGVLHDLGRDGMDGVLALTWGIIVTHRSAARDALKKVRRKIGAPTNPSRELRWTPRKLPDLATSTCPLKPDAIRGEDIAYFVEREYAQTLADIFCRRTALLWNGLITPDLVEAVADRMGDLLCWDPAARTREIEDFGHYMRTCHRHVHF